MRNLSPIINVAFIMTYVPVMMAVEFITARLARRNQSGVTA